MSAVMDKARAVLQDVFGYRDFVSLQEQIIAHVICGGDALVVMPTGGGKSLCYQIPALLFDGLTLVVSPLISLMNDQIQQLRQNGVPAALLNSALDAGAYRYNVEQIKTGRAKLLYVAPETLLKETLLEVLASVEINCLAVDEAHCVSEWGHDFRPEYRRLAEVRSRFPKAVCLALTATATDLVRRDINKCLGLSEGAEFISGFDRPNLFLQVACKEDPYRQVMAMIHRHADQPGIIYCATRRQVDQLCQSLIADGITALPYHAGLPDAERHRHQASFSRDDVQVMVATVAFGMGIDKSNIRFVIHYDLPKNMESYYQEIGRAGRDGLEARCLLLYSFGDIHKVKYMIDQMDPSRQRTANLLLTALLRYVETDVCRRRVLLDYFGERYPQKTCGRCDNCLDAEKETEDLSVLAQKLLSCVKRTGESFGVEHVIDVLRGSKARKIVGRGHHKLTTYGIGLEYSRHQWRHLARQLLHKGFMIQDMEYGGLQLTPKAWELFRGQAEFRGFLPARTTVAEETAGRPSAQATNTPHDPALFALLREKRKQLADEAKVPPFVIFSDRTLLEMAAWFPHSRESLLQISGVGRVKEKRYGDIFLDIIRSYCAENRISEPCRPQSQVSGTSSGSTSGRKRRYQEIGQAYNDGRSIAQLMAQYAIKRATVISHLYRYWQDGHHLRCDDLPAATELTAQKQMEVFHAFDRLGIEALRPVYDALNQIVGYDDLQVLRLDYIARHLPPPAPEEDEAAESRPMRQIVCLANSRKHSGRCIAGKEWLDGRVGKWIRPVSDTSTGELPENHISVANGQTPGLLDILALPLADACPRGCQAENCFIDEKIWRKTGVYPLSRMEDLIDEADTLWINGFHSFSGRNDRIPVEKAATLDSSLLFIRPQNLCILVEEGADSLKRVRARFGYKDQVYCLGVTDPHIEARFIKQDLGQYALGSDLVGLTVSISEPYKGFCYKLVAAVIYRNDHTAEGPKGIAF